MAPTEGPGLFPQRGPAFLIFRSALLRCIPSSAGASLRSLGSLRCRACGCFRYRSTINQKEFSESLHRHRAEQLEAHGA